MFIVNIAGQKHLFLNSKNDDFLRFIAEKFDVEPNEVTAEYVPDAEQKAMRREMKLNPHKNYQFDLDAKKLVEVTPPQGEVGTAILDEKNPLNKKSRDNSVDELDPKAKKKNNFDALTEEKKKEYLLSITWDPRKWEVEAYEALIGPGRFKVLTADSVEAKEQRKDVLSFTTKKVKELRYKKQRNSVTGSEETVLDEMIFEEGV